MAAAVVRYTGNGRVYLVPAVAGPDESVRRVLTEVLGIHLEEKEPDWAAAISAPGQGQIDRAIKDTAETIESAKAKLSSLKNDRAAARELVGLLYQRGEILEQLVRRAFTALGAEVTEPSEQGKEDGWIRIDVDGVACHGVLEIKGTRSDTFDETGLRQLLEWTLRGEQGGISYKGIFVGASAIDRPLGERPGPFSASWVRSAKRYGMTLLTTQQLFRAYSAIALGEQEPRAFWSLVFEGSGPVQESWLGS